MPWVLLGVAAFGAIFARQLTSSLAAATGPGVHISASGGQQPELVS